MRKRDVDKEIEELGSMVRRLRGDICEEEHTARKCAAGCQSYHGPLQSILRKKQRSTSRKRKAKFDESQSTRDWKEESLGEERRGMTSTWKSTQTTEDRATSPRAWTEDEQVGKSLSKRLVSSARLDEDRPKTEAPKVPYCESKIEPGQPVDYYAKSIQKYSSQKWDNIVFEPETSHGYHISTRDSNQSLNLDAKASITELSSELRSLHHEMQALTAERTPSPQKRDKCEFCHILLSKGFSKRHCWAHRG